MKIKVIAVPNEKIRHFVYDLQDNGISESQWEAMSKEEQNEKLQEFLDTEPEMPYWQLDMFEPA